ncbi:hypothetical protein LOZ27_005676 [Ophidiomyces ophidiicola]|nr:hypothetical protein LOZ27_005676 [Ophidiomyces ophidiicola]
MSTEAIDEIRPFKECLGSWRPDILIENASDTSEVAERFVLCEINARFSFNGFILSSSGQQALQDMGSEDKCMLSVLEPSEVVDSLLNCFDPTRPLHLLKGEEHGHDIHLFVQDVERRTGAAPIFISPEDLRLVPTDSSKFGYKLCSTVKEESPQSRGSSQSSTMTKAWRSARFIYGGEILEEVHQVGLELHQRELRELSPEMLRHLALRCFNDMRTIFLVHDKRMLGILLQELDSLVTNHGVLTKEQARALRAGIVTTYLPGSQELEHMIVKSKCQPELKNNYLLKPIRSGKGAGIIFGDEISNSEWQDKLETLRRPDITSGQPIYIVQRQINQPTYQVLAREEDGLQQNRLVGTYLAIHGKFLGLGIWRCGPGRICAVSRGGAVIFSVLSSAHRIETPRRSCTTSKPLGWFRLLSSWVKTQLACSAKNIN